MTDSNATTKNFQPTFGTFITPPPLTVTVENTGDIRHRTKASEIALVLNCCVPGSVASPLPGSYVPPTGRTDIRTLAAPRSGMQTMQRWHASRQEPLLRFCQTPFICRPASTSGRCVVKLLNCGFQPRCTTY